MSRHDLRACPVFHHTRDATWAHLTVVMASLAVARYLQDATGISIKRVIRTLKPLQDVTINLNGRRLPPRVDHRCQRHPHRPEHTTPPRHTKRHESGLSLTAIWKYTTDLALSDLRPSDLKKGRPRLFILCPLWTGLPAQSSPRDG